MHSPAPVRMIDRITPLVITYNDASNIARTLDRLTWAKRIVVAERRRGLEEQIVGN